MKFLIVTHVPHAVKQKQYYGYAPYVREMNIWIKQRDELIIIAPLENRKPTAIDTFYEHKNIDFRSVAHFNLTNFSNTITSIFKLPKILFQIVIAMQDADHIHLRCPGNMGLLACLVQIVFPSKPKTAKYAGNWDPKATQPLTYRLQKWILNNTFLTRNMQVLVYGNWKNQSKNIKPFFTATYSEAEKNHIQKTIHPNTKIKFIFVGSLVAGKNPMYAIQLVEQLQKTNKNVVLDLYGEGTLRTSLEKYIDSNNLKEYVFLHGNQNKEVLKKAYQQSHFVILPSKSEGWPKAIAEGMFWGCVPLATAVSCVPDMLDHGNRGVLLQMNFNTDAAVINKLIENSVEFEQKSSTAASWSQNYTLERFENEIQKLIQA